jgi:hypothetical protein
VRAPRLLRLAMQAEALRLRHQARRTLTRFVVVCFALALLLGTLTFGHVAAWFWLREHMAGQYVALIFAGIDLFVAMILAVLASRSSPGRLELEALEVRRRALDDAAGSLSVMAMAIRAVELLMSLRSRK